MAATLTFSPITFAMPSVLPLIGAGGFVTGGDIADDGKIVARCDSAGPVIRATGASEWTRLMRAGINVDASLLINQQSTYDVAICATNSQIAYWVLQSGYVYKTTDGGTTVTRTALAAQANCNANEANRMTGKMLAVDPINGSVCFFGTQAGLKYTLDGGANWTSVSTGTIPAPTSGQRTIIAFDRSSAQTGGKTQGIYVFVNGSGLYRSTNGGSTWAAVSGAPTAAAHLRVGASNGYVHLAGAASEADGQYRRWDGTTWIAPASAAGTKSLALSTLNAGRMWACSVGGYLQVSNDHGATWTANYAPTRSGGDTLWHDFTNEAYMTNGSIEFDPIANRLWMLEGIGAWKCDSPPANITGSTTWASASRGIENMSSTNLTVASNGAVGYACQDRAAFVIPKASAGVTLPATHANNVGVSIAHGGGCDWALNDPTFWVATTFPQGPTPRSGWFSCYSTDTGATWNQMSGSIAVASTALDAAATASPSDSDDHVGGGNIIALSKTVFIQCETNNGYLMRTADAGATWTRCTIGNNLDTQGHSAYYLRRTVLVKDIYNAGCAWYYHAGSQSGDANAVACRGIWKTTDYGVTWTRIKSTNINGVAQDAFNGKLKQRGPNQLLWACGDSAVELWYSNDGGATWGVNTAPDNITAGTHFGEIYSFGVGAPIISGGPNTVLVAGNRWDVNQFGFSYSAYGFWLSIDGMATWKLVTRFPDGYYAVPISDLAGDPTQFGVFYVARDGEGASKLVITA